MPQREEVMPGGYDEEERYFHERDRELLKRKREELDAARAERQQQARRHAHWMKCPKCGEDLREVEMDRVKVDRCETCGGIFFDKGEVQLMIEVHKGGLIKTMRRLFAS